MCNTGTSAIHASYGHMAHRKCDDSVFAYKLSGRAMIFPFGVQFHAEQRLVVWRPRGTLNEKELSDVVAALGQLEAQFRAPFNRFADLARVDAVNINYEYVFTVSLYRSFAYAHRPPIKSAILAIDPTLVDYGRLHSLSDARLIHQCARFPGRPPCDCAMARRAG